MEIYIFYILIFLIGIFFGSFLNVVVERLPLGRSIIYPPSHCPHCRHRLGFFDLIPLFSFIFLGRHCRYCKAKISWYYPITELFTGFLFCLTAFMVIGTPVILFLEQLTQLWFFLYLLFLISIFILVFFIDLRFGIIPFKIVVLALAVILIRFIFLGFTDFHLVLNYLISSISVFVVFLLLFLSTRGRAIGFGDVFFSLLMGLILGFPKILLAVYIAFLTGAFISLILVLVRKKKFKGGTIPFGPFLVFATIVCLFWGDLIVSKILVYLHV